MSIENIRTSKQGRDYLLKLKRLTGITNWNVLCRWAFCISLAEDNPPREDHIPSDSSVEMTWRTFGGEYADIYFALLKQRCKKEGFDMSDENLAKQFRLHLHRGIGYLAGDPEIKSISGLICKALSNRQNLTK